MSLRLSFCGHVDRDYLEPQTYAEKQPNTQEVPFLLVGPRNSLLGGIAFWESVLGCFPFHWAVL